MDSSGSPIDNGTYPLEVMACVSVLIIAARRCQYETGSSERREKFLLDNQYPRSGSRRDIFQLSIKRLLIDRDAWVDDGGEFVVIDRTTYVS